ncbi:Origin recognition complex subunit 2 [Mortierella sp. GBA35]|nr:Origin recognition complex subunit 2 [Mortierella sp. GBA35]
MVRVLYQGNDEIPTHIICQVSAKDAERESALAAKFKKVTSTSGQQRKRPAFRTLHSGLTVEKLDSTASKVKNIKEDQERTAALQDVFLPTTTTQAIPAPTSSASFSKSISGGNITSASAATITTTTTTTTSAIGSASKTTAVTGVESLGGQLAKKDDEEMEDPTIRHARGREVFGFQTQRKPAGLKSLIEQQKNQINTTSAAVMTSTSLSSTPTTTATAKSKAAKGSKEKAETEEDITADRSAKRRKVTKAISQMNHAGSDVSEDSDEEESDQESDSDDEAQNHRRNDSLLEETARDATQAAGEQKSFFEEDEMGAERYFQDLYQKSKTSNNTLSKLPTLEHADFIHAIKRAPTKHAQEMEMLRLLYEEQFSQWFFELVSGFNLLIYGYGSKRQLLTHANILWDTVKSARFNWVWHELTTFKPYLTETSFENSIMVRQGELGARGIQFVLASLTSNGKGLFKVLAEHQIQAETNEDGGGGSVGGGGGGTKNYMDLGMAYNALFKKCQENFLVSNAVTFRTQLTEFRDHRIVQSKKGPDGVEILFIPLSASILEGILDNMT